MPSGSEGKVNALGRISRTVPQNMPPVQSWFIDYDAQAVERLGEPVDAVEGSVHNIKITTPEDLRLVEMLLQKG